jgi:hypothetical protein
VEFFSIFCVFFTSFDGFLSFFDCLIFWILEAFF